MSAGTAGVYLCERYIIPEKPHSTLYTVRRVIGKLRKPRLQPQVHQSREQREDRQHIEEPGTAQTSLQVDALPQEGSEVEVQVPIIYVVQRGQEEAAPVTMPIGHLDTHTCLGTRGGNNVGLTHTLLKCTISVVTFDISLEVFLLLVIS